MNDSTNFARSLVKLLERYESFPICMKEKPKWLENLTLLSHFQVSFGLRPNFLIFYMKNVFMVRLVLLSGGYGTMEEVLEMITWSQLGIHKKPVSFFYLFYFSSV